MRRLTMARLAAVLARQEPPRYGADYVPAIRASREEAPAISRCTRLYSTRFQRDIHLLSEAETDAALLALYHPGLIDLHEQRVLSRWPAPHPVETYPGYRGISLPGVRGTLEVSERLGVLDFHPLIGARAADGTRRAVAFPMIGDLLLFLRDDRAAVRCLNWNIKTEARDFGRPPPEAPETPHRIVKAVARIAVEETYYADAEIRTQRIAGEDIDREVRRNLRLLYPYAERLVPLPETEICSVLAMYGAALASATPITEVMLALMRRHGHAEIDLRTIYYQAIWQRRLRVSLYAPILIDRVPRAESRDVLLAYASWFDPG